MDVYCVALVLSSLVTVAHGTVDVTRSAGAEVWSKPKCEKPFLTVVAPGGWSNISWEDLRVRRDPNNWVALERVCDGTTKAAVIVALDAPHDAEVPVVLEACPRRLSAVNSRD